MNIVILEKKEYDERLKRCKQLLDSAETVTTLWKSVRVWGWPQDALASYLRPVSDRSILVMGTVCRTGISGLFIGNTAESILDVVDRSTVTVKPDGFSSPIV